MVDAFAGHAPGLLPLTGTEEFAGEIPLGVSPAHGLLPDEDAQFVAPVQHGLALGVVTAPDEVAALSADQFQIAPDEGLGHGVAEIGVAVVAVVAQQFNGFPVDEELSRPGFDGPHAERGFANMLPRRNGEAVEMGGVGAPELEIGNGQGENPLPAGEFPGNGGFAVEGKGNFRPGGEGARKLHRDVGGPGGEVPGNDFHVRDLPLGGALDGDGAVDAAVAVEVVEAGKEGVVGVVGPVVHGDEERVLLFLPRVKAVLSP